MLASLTLASAVAASSGKRLEQPVNRSKHDCEMYACNAATAPDYKRWLKRFYTPPRTSLRAATKLLFFGHSHLWEVALALLCTVSRTLPRARSRAGIGTWDEYRLGNNATVVTAINQRMLSDGSQRHHLLRSFLEAGEFTHAAVMMPHPPCFWATPKNCTQADVARHVACWQPAFQWARRIFAAQFRPGRWVEMLPYYVTSRMLDGSACEVSPDSDAGLGLSSNGHGNPSRTRLGRAPWGDHFILDPIAMWQNMSTCSVPDCPPSASRAGLFGASDSSDSPLVPINQTTGIGHPVGHQCLPGPPSLHADLLLGPLVELYE